MINDMGSEDNMTRESSSFAAKNTNSCANSKKLVHSINLPNVHQRVGECKKEKAKMMISNLPGEKLY